MWSGIGGVALIRLASNTFAFHAALAAFPALFAPLFVVYLKGKFMFISNLVWSDGVIAE